jgi:photosystem II stability/assembly factor-like uncharacterized protein
MPDKLIETNTSVFLAIGNQRIQRAACVPGEDWWVETVLNEPVKPVTLAADPANAAHVFAGTNGKGIYHSTDKGETWSHLGLDGQIVKSIAVSPHNSKVIYAGVKPAAMFKSVDGGHTWAELDGFRRIPNRWWWFSPAEKPFQPYVMAIAVSPTEPDVVLAGIEFGAVVRSEDGGRSWSGHRQGAIRDCHSLKFHAHSGQWAYEAGGTGGGAAVTRDGGRTWHQPKAGLVKHYGVACAADPERPEVWYASVARGPGKAYGDGAEAYLYRASGGADWQPIGWEPQPMGQMPLALVTVPGRPGHLYAGTSGGQVWLSTDYGDSWSRLPFNLGVVGLSMLVQ